MLERIAFDDSAGLLAVRGEFEEPRLVGTASRVFPGTRSLAELRLSGEATVGDLLLALAEGRLAPDVPLALD